ncbi:HD domain-containing protein [Sulfurimonas indica]|uniref:HD domain-containing protein n=1 Tax=Sulfurimonas TaxID=202746 RepID=UPI0012630BF4|nr:HD domain-containing protein [Sulfurimonas indica]
MNKFIDIANIYNLFLKLEERRALSPIIEDVVDVPLIENEKEELLDVVQYIIKRTPSFKKTIKNILNLMIEYDFANTPSVDKNYDIYLKKTFSNYDLLYEIDLFTHSTNVAYETLKLSKQGNTAGINVMCALLHDFGKSLAVKRLVHNSAKMSHEKISAKFLQDYLSSEALNGNREITKDVVDTVYQTINVQHSPVKIKNDFLKDLILADKNARTQEIIYVKKYIKPGSSKEEEL